MSARWVKLFSDKTNIISDEVMEMSWKHTRLDGMISAFMSNSTNMGVTIKGKGKYLYLEKHQATFSGEEFISTIFRYWPISNQMFVTTEYDNSQWSFFDLEDCNPYGVRIHIPKGHYLEVELSSSKSIIDYKVIEGGFVG